jgi:hypothetical protein
MTTDKKSILDYVPAARRDFLKRLLAGAAFAAPVIATFSIDALSNSAYAAGITKPVNTTLTLTAPNTVGNQACAADAGYDGPLTFQAHVTSRFTLLPAVQAGHRVNGEVTLHLSAVGTGISSVNEITGIVSMVSGATITGGSITVGGRAATANLVITGGAFSITNANVTPAVCDLDELADMMASGEATITIDGIYQGSPYNVSGPITGLLSLPTV